MTTEIIVACAGSGKTQYILDSALACQDEIAIVTYTEQNRDSIIQRIVQKCGSVPGRITVQTWFSFMIEHGIKPYLSQITDKKITGLCFTSPPKYIKKTELDYYFNDDMEVYRDRVSDLVILLNEKNSGKVINRIGMIFNHIYFDEGQDLSGYDYDLIELIQDNIDVTLVGDPRQRTYVTNNGMKNKTYTDIFDYFKKKQVFINYNKLNVNHRCVTKIGELSDLLFPDLPHTTCDLTISNIHCGIFYVKKCDIESYLKQIPNVVQLRYNRTTKCSKISPVSNFGESKGLEYDHVLIYLTEKMFKWLDDNDYQLSGETRCKLYVAITRAKYSVAFVVPDNDCSHNHWFSQEISQQAK